MAAATAGEGVTRHMWGGIALTIGVVGCAACPWCFRRPARDLSVPAGLRAASAGMDGAPGRFADPRRQLSDRIYARTAEAFGRLGDGARRKPSTFPDSFYAAHLYPIFDANCVVCHGPERSKAACGWIL